MIRYTSKEKGTTESSPDFRFNFPTVNKTFVFAFQMEFNDNKKDEKNDDFGLYLMNENQVT